MTKQHRLHRITIFVNRETGVVERTMIDAEVLQNDTDEDFEWQNIERDYSSLSPAKQAAIKTLVTESM